MDLGELVAKLKLDPSHFSKGVHEAENKVHGLGRTIGKIAGAFAVFEAGKKVFDFFKDAAKESQRFEDQFAGLSTVIANQAQKSGQPVKELTDSMREYIDKARMSTGATIDSLVPALTRLEAATGNVKTAQGAMDIAMDVAAARHMDVTAVATALGKAYQGNVTGLQRLGIGVKDAHGKALPLAQIMEKLKTTYGGAAEAIMNVDPWKKLGAMWDVMKEKLGAALLPALNKIGNWVIDHFPQIESVVSKVAKAIGAALGWVAQYVLPLLAKAFAWVEQYVVPVVKRIVSFIGQVIDAFKGGGLSGGFSKIGEIIGKVAGVIGPKLLALGKKFIEWIGPMIPPMLHKLGELLAHLAHWILHTALPSIVSHLVVWAKAFASWIGPHIPGILKELGKLVYKIAKWIITDALPTIAIQLAKLALGLLEALGTALKPLGLIMAKPFERAWSAIKDAFWTGIDFIASIPGKIKGYFVDALSWLSKAGSDIIGGLWSALTSAYNGVAGWFTGLGTWIKNSFVDAIHWLESIGRDIINGLWNGMKAIWDKILGWAKSAADGLSSAFKWVLGIKSPSTVFYGHGANIMKGLHMGMRSEFDNVGRTMSALHGMLGVETKSSSSATRATRRTSPVSSSGYARGGTVVFVTNSREAQDAKRTLRSKYAWAAS